MSKERNLSQTTFRHRRITELVIGLHLFTAVTYPAPLLYLQSIPIFFIDITAILLVAWTLVNNNWRITCPDRRLFEFFAVFLFAAFVALFHGLSLSGFSYLYIYTMGRLLLNITAPLALMTAIETRFHLRAAVVGITIGLITISLIGIIQMSPYNIRPLLHAYYPPDSFAHYRVRSVSLQKLYAFATWYTATSYSGVISIVILFPLISLLRNWKVRYIIPFLIGVVGFVLAETRHAFLALGLLLLFIAWHHISLRQKVSLGIAGSIIFIILEVVSLGPTPTGFIEDFAQLFGSLSNQEGIKIRIQSHLDFFWFAFHHPIRTGIGFGPDFVSISDRGIGNPILLAANNAFPLNSILGYVLGYGIFGTAAYFAIALHGIRRGISRLKNTNFNQISQLTFISSVIYMSTSALIVGLFLHPFDQYFARSAFEIRHVFWGILAIQQSALGMDERRREPS